MLLSTVDRRVNLWTSATGIACIQSTHASISQLFLFTDLLERRNVSLLTDSVTLLRADHLYLFGTSPVVTRKKFQARLLVSSSISLSLLRPICGANTSANTFFDILTPILRLIFGAKIVLDSPVLPPILSPILNSILNLILFFHTGFLGSESFTMTQVLCTFYLSKTNCLKLLK